MTSPSTRNDPLFSGTLGLLGGGQLGRMSAMAAARLGIAVHSFSPDRDSPSSYVSRRTVTAAYDDKDALRDFAAGVDVISYEFENIPLETIRFLETLKPVYPDSRLLETSQHRWKEKAFVNAQGIPTPRWAKATHPDDVAEALKEWNLRECILKTATLGYDGKGQTSFSEGDDLSNLWAFLAADEVIVEERVDFACEISVLVARDKFGGLAIYDPSLNAHVNHILARTTVPSGQSENVLKTAMEHTATLAEKTDLRGFLAVEMFVTRMGAVLVNELAPRPHNSGHWTIDGCGVSQFEQHVRTVCGLPVGSPERHSDAVMMNLIGEDVSLAAGYLDTKGVCVHLYGKREVRPGRKMGHVTILKDKSA